MTEYSVQSNRQKQYVLYTVEEKCLKKWTVRINYVAWVSSLALRNDCFKMWRWEYTEQTRVCKAGEHTGFPLFRGTKQTQNVGLPMGIFYDITLCLSWLYTVEETTTILPTAWFKWEIRFQCSITLRCLYSHPFGFLLNIYFFPETRERHHFIWTILRITASFLAFSFLC